MPETSFHLFFARLTSHHSGLRLNAVTSEKPSLTILSEIAPFPQSLSCYVLMTIVLTAIRSFFSPTFFALPPSLEMYRL